MKGVKLLIVSVFIFNSYAFSQNSFVKELTRRLSFDLEPPEFCLQDDSCYRYTELLKIEIEKVHPYETPCIMKFNVEANEAYEEWIEKESSAEKIED